MIKVFKTSFFILTVFSILNFPVMSYSPYLEQIIELYNVRVKCEICHLGTTLNSYGSDFYEELKLDKDIIKALKNIEKLDSDKDGFINIEELKKESLPSDKISIPKLE